MFQKTLQELGGVMNQKRQALWATKSFTATAEDVANGFTVGKTYVLWVAQRDGKTQKGTPVTKGDWFAVESE